MASSPSFRSKSGNLKSDWKKARLYKNDLWRFVAIVLMLLILAWLTSKINIVNNSSSNDGKQLRKEVGVAGIGYLNESTRWKRQEYIWQNRIILQILDIFSRKTFDELIALGIEDSNLDGYITDVGENEKIRVVFPKRFENPLTLTRNDLKISIIPILVNQDNTVSSRDSELLIYDEVYTNTAFVREMREDGWKEYILLKNESAPKSFLFHLLVERGRAEMKNGSIKIINDDGREIMKFRAIQAWDAQRNIIDKNLSYNLFDDGILEIKISDSDQIRYPILIDPGIKIIQQND